MIDVILLLSNVIGVISMVTAVIVHLFIKKYWNALFYFVMLMLLVYSFIGTIKGEFVELKL